MLFTQRNCKKIVTFWVIPFILGGGVGIGYTITKRIFSRLDSFYKSPEKAKKNLERVNLNQNFRKENLEKFKKKGYPGGLRKIAHENQANKCMQKSSEIQKNMIVLQSKQKFLLPIKRKVEQGSK